MVNYTSLEHILKSKYPLWECFSNDWYWDQNDQTLQYNDGNPYAECIGFEYHVYMPSNEIHNIEGVVLIDIDDDGDFYTYVLDPAKQIFEL